MIHSRDITHFHFCCGIGGAAKGFNRASPRVGNVVGRMRCLGGVDVSAAAICNFDRIVGVPGTVMDLFTRGQYTAFHGKEPPAGWREMGPSDIRRAAGNERPNIVFISSPCKGASGLLSETMSQTPKYQALNELTLRCIWLMAEAWADDPVDLIVFENVPRLATRGRHLLDQINQVLHRYGYAVAETAGYRLVTHVWTLEFANQIKGLRHRRYVHTWNSFLWTYIQLLSILRPPPSDRFLCERPHERTRKRARIAWGNSSRPRPPLAHFAYVIGD